ncbi:MAG TPA: ABC transporter ATP-binding protein [Caulobacteraceae bacterium]|nr:ABC transporter ATP-binding protein [Caulobacteraceae bacterium]
MSYSYGGGAPTGGPAGVQVRPQIDVKAMPHILRRIVAMALRIEPWQVVLAIGCALGAAVANLAVPRLFGHAVDQAMALATSAAHGRAAHLAAAQQHLLESHALDTLLITAAIVVGVTTLQGILTGLSGYQAEKVSQKVAYQLRLDYFRQLQRLSFGFHDTIHSGDLITRGMIDLEGARMFIQNGMMQVVTLTLLLVVATTMMFSTDWVMALLGLSFAPISIFTLGRVGYLLRIAWMRVQNLMSVLTLTMEENLQGIRVVRAFASRTFELAKFDKAATEALREAYKRIILRMRAMRTTTLTFYISQALVLWYGGHKVASGHMTPGVMATFVLYLNVLQGPVRQFIMVVMSAARATSCGTRLFEILDTPAAIADKPDAEPLRPTRGVLRFEHVDFAYEPGGKLILQDIDFEVGLGQTLGIVGPPGSGKSTLANLVPRFYDITAGRITIDGVDIRDVTLSSLREYVGLVQQEAFLFDSTVTNNVAYADPWAEEARIVGATRTAQLHDYIAALPGGYGTRVGERGVALSGGQRQRMSIARGVVPGPGIMIFDDSTAAIDAVTEKRVRDALAEATRQKATIIIAHRLSSLMHADEIIVLEEGRIVERGSHEELLALGGEYYDLFQLQTRAEQGLSIADARIRRRVKEAAE